MADRSDVTTSCPTDQQLEDYACGALSAGEMEAIEQHAEHCDTCAIKLANATALSQVLEDVQQASQEDTVAVTGDDIPPRGARDEDALIGRVIGDFEVRRLIGSGGMGAVYEAQQISLKRRVALKVLHRPMGDKTAGGLRFGREAQAAARLHHTNIVSVFAQGESGGYRYYAMEMIHGTGLDQIIREIRRQRAEDEAADRGNRSSRRAPKPSWLRSSVDLRGDFDLRRRLVELDRLDARKRLDLTARLIADVADALDYAHRQRVIHRDVKPGNMILSADGRLSLTDFGLARVLEQPSMTIAGEFLGSPLYMSPEQVASGRVSIDHRTDIYSLGATLYELLCLEPPYRGETREQVISQIREGTLRRPRRLDKRIPRDLETICLKAMRTDPNHRYATAGEMATDLRRFVRRFAVRARRVTLLDRGVKFLNRHSMEAAMLTGVATVIVGASLVAIHERRNTQLATEQWEAADIKANELWRRWDALQLERALERGYDAAYDGRFRQAHAWFSEAVRRVKNDPRRFRSRDPSIPLARGVSGYLGEIVGVNPGTSGFRGDFESALALRPESNVLSLLAVIPNPTGPPAPESKRAVLLSRRMASLSDDDIEEVTRGRGGLVYVALAWAALRAKDSDLALRLIDEALAKRRTIVIGYFVRAIILLSKNDPGFVAQAQVALSLLSPRQLTDQATSAAGFLVRAVLMFALGRPEEALRQSELGRELLRKRRETVRRDFRGSPEPASQPARRRR